MTENLTATALYGIYQRTKRPPVPPLRTLTLGTVALVSFRGLVLLCCFGGLCLFWLLRRSPAMESELVWMFLSSASASQGLVLESNPTAVSLVSRDTFLCRQKWGTKSSTSIHQTKDRRVWSKSFSYNRIQSKTWNGRLCLKEHKAKPTLVSIGGLEQKTWEVARK